MDLFVIVVTRRLSCPVIESFGDDDGLGVRGLHCGTQRHRRWGRDAHAHGAIGVVGMGSSAFGR